MLVAMFAVAAHAQIWLTSDLMGHRMVMPSMVNPFGFRSMYSDFDLAPKVYTTADMNMIHLLKKK